MDLDYAADLTLLVLLSILAAVVLIFLILVVISLIEDAIDTAREKPIYTLLGLLVIGVLIGVVYKAVYLAQN